MKTLREYIDQIDILQEGWKKGAAIGGALGGLAGGIPGAVIGAGVGGVAQSIHGQVKQELEKDKAKKKQEQDLENDNFSKEYYKWFNHFLEIKQFYENKWKIRSNTKRPGDVRFGKEDYENPERRNYLEKISIQYLKEIESDVFNNPIAYADRLERMKQLVNDYKNYLKNVDIEAETTKEPDSPIEEEATPDAVKRIEELVKYK